MAIDHQVDHQISKPKPSFATIASWEGGGQIHHTVDGRNLAPVDVVNIPVFIGVYTSQVVQDYFHQQYD